jgi:hypothetical protein
VRHISYGECLGKLEDLRLMAYWQGRAGRTFHENGSGILVYTMSLDELLIIISTRRQTPSDKIYTTSN